MAEQQQTGGSDPVHRADRRARDAAEGLPWLLALHASAGWASPPC